MSKIKNLGMAQAVIAHEHVQVNQTMFGMCEKAVYTPTGSRIKADKCYCTPEVGSRIEALANCPSDKLVAAVRNIGTVTPQEITGTLVEFCKSDDNRFVAIQEFRYGDFRYNPVSPAMFFEGPDAVTVSEIFK